MNEQDIEQLFNLHDIRPTAVRMLIWRIVNDLDFAFSLADIEAAMPSLDKSTVFRTLSIFVQHGLLHNLSDGSGQQKYCICCSFSNDVHQACNHVHMKCTKCGKTFCLKDVEIPKVDSPRGFRIERITYLIEGTCSHCAHFDIDGESFDCCCHNHSES